MSAENYTTARKRFQLACVMLFICQIPKLNDVRRKKFKMSCHQASALIMAYFPVVPVE